MNEHTPAPWNRGRTLLTTETAKWTEKQIAGNDKIEASMIFGSFTQSDEGKGRELIATVNRSSPNYKANANLIEAAPDMLEALRQVRMDCLGLSIPNETWHKMYDVIAKAEGK